MQDPEECEPKLEPETCTSLCQQNECGDGEILENETCDDENDNDNDACTNACHEAICGDGIVHEGEEQCDGGDVPSCEELGLQGNALACDQMACLVIGCGDCGNGKLEANEFCEVGEILSCESLGLGGEAEVTCGEECVPNDPVGCCLLPGQPCDGGADLECCEGECDGGTCPQG